MATSTKRKREETVRWAVEESPRRHSWIWYMVLVTLGVGSALYIHLSGGDLFFAAMLFFWPFAAISITLTPARTVGYFLDRRRIVCDVKGDGTRLEERFLNHYATFSIQIFPGDRLNPPRQKLALLRLDGGGKISIPLPDDPPLRADIIDRMSAALPISPMAPLTLQDRFWDLADRLFGWR